MPDSPSLRPSPGATSPPPGFPEVFPKVFPKVFPEVFPKAFGTGAADSPAPIPRESVPRNPLPRPPIPFPAPPAPTLPRTASRSARPIPFRPPSFRPTPHRNDRRKDPREVPWGLPLLLGRLTEISGSGASGVLSCALGLIAEAQRDEARYGPPAWVGSTGSLFFPPDAVRAGVSPERLVLLRLPSPSARFHAATTLVRSGAFGLVVVDLADSGRAPSDLAPIDLDGIDLDGIGFPGNDRTGGRGTLRNGGGIPPLARLAGLAHRHCSAVVALTEKPATAPSLDPRVLGRYDANHAGDGLRLTVVKDKRRGDDPLSRPPLPPGFRFTEECDVPSGMC